MKRLSRTSANFMISVGVGLLSVLLLSGCATSDGRMRTGVSVADYEQDLKPGDAVPEFVFIGENQQMVRFREVKGQITLVLFPSNPTWPDCAMCRQVAEIAKSESTPSTRVVVINVGQPSRPVAETLPALQACQIRSDHLIAICDHNGHIKQLYGPMADGRFFVVDHDGRISDVGPVDDLNALRSQIRKAVRTVNDRDVCIVG